MSVGVTTTGVRYAERGRGRPVVFVHGWCLNRRMWTRQEESLRDSHRVVLPDLPGFGASDGLDGPYTFDRYANELRTLMTELELKDASLVGFAFGAAVAMSLAAREPAMIRDLVLAGIPSGSEGAPYARMPRAMRRDWPGFARRSAEAICTAADGEATVRWIEGMFVATSLTVAVETVAALEAFDPYVLASQVSVPALFVHGEKDDVAPLEVAKRCAAQMRAAELEVIPGAGHLVVLAPDDAFDRTLHRYLPSS